MIFTNQKASPDARRQSVQAFLQLFGGQSVKFSFTESPQTDGKTVWLGNLDPSNENFELYAAGHGVHEMMHVMCTDFAATPKKSLRMCGSTRSAQKPIQATLSTVGKWQKSSCKRAVCMLARRRPISRLLASFSSGCMQP